MSLPSPNYTQIPNAILDHMSTMRESELKVVLAIARQTFGWHKQRDILSLQRLMDLTGLARSTVVSGINDGLDRGIIVRTPARIGGKDSFAYELCLDQADPSEIQTAEFPTSRNSEPVLVGNSNHKPALLVGNSYPQKKDSKERDLKKEDRASDDASPPDKKSNISPSLSACVSTEQNIYAAPPRDSTCDHPAVVAYRHRFALTPNKAQRSLLAERVDNATLWQATLDLWAARGWSPRNIHGMLDRYDGLADEQRKAAEHKAAEEQAQEERRQRHEQRLTPAELGSQVREILLRQYGPNHPALVKYRRMIETQGTA